MRLFGYALLAAIIGILPTALLGYTITSLEWWLLVVPSDFLAYTLFKLWENNHENHTK